MGLPILIIGKSGSGKSASLRNFKANEVGIINVLGKTLPFKNDFKYIVSDDYTKIKTALLSAKVNTLVIDDAGYLLTNMFMREHSTKGQGSAVFDLYNKIGDKFWDLINFIQHQLPEERIVYLFMHEDKNDFGDIKPKAIGRMLDEKVCIEGMFTIVLRAMIDNGKYVFRTITNGFDVTKSPIGMFDNEFIDNDLKLVTDTIKKYYNMEEKLNEKD